MAGPTIDQQGTALVKAAHSAGIPVSILLGIYAMESSFGTNHNTSSAGAMGPFQFLPSTAVHWNYPLTNNPTAAQFQQQANAAANYLASLFKTSKDWNKAVLSYSGGGYNADTAQKTAAQAGTSHLDLLDAITSAGIKLGTGDTSVTGGTPLTAGVQQAANTAQSVGSTVGRIADLVTSTSFWLRIGEGIAAVLLIYLGLHALTGQSSTPGAQVKHVTRIIPI